MKWATPLTVFLLSCLAVAIPIEAEGVIAAPEVVTEVIVYVDENRQTVSVETLHPTATIDNAQTALPPILAVPEQDAPHNLEPTLATDDNVYAEENPNQDEDDGMNNMQNTQLFGISYSPYNTDGSCKDQARVNNDVDKLTKYAFIRIYGVDCDQARKVIIAARRHELKVFAGVYDLQNLHENLNTIIDAAKPDLSTLHTISIGNELLNRGQSSAEDVVNAVHDARDYLRSVGYTGPVVTIDTFSKVFEHPELCDASDYCAANCHAFFDANQTPESAGPYVRDISHHLSEIAGGKRTLITESGWPHAGQTNGHAVPTPENQRKAIDSLRQAFWNDNGNLILFSAFDDLWKVDNQWTFGAEKFWGIEKR
ncbi:glycoside hydrolase superfamily [Aspergillus varians]